LKHALRCAPEINLYRKASQLVVSLDVQHLQGCRKKTQRVAELLLLYDAMYSIFLCPSIRELLRFPLKSYHNTQNL